jgi:molecular chaperone GrpE
MDEKKDNIGIAPEETAASAPGEKGDDSQNEKSAGDEKEQRRRKFRRKDDHDAAQWKDEAVKKDEEIRSLTEEVAALKDTMARRQADFENFKKRNLKQQEDFRKFAVKDLALDILNINDNLLRAIDAANSSEDNSSVASLTEGVMMISNMIEDTLQKYGVEEVEALDCDFDPTVHEAVEIAMSEEVSKDTVTMVHQKGFSLHGVVLRTAKVKVTKPEPNEAQG